MGIEATAFAQFHFALLCFALLYLLNYRVICKQTARWAQWPRCRFRSLCWA